MVLALLTLLYAQADVVMDQSSPLQNWQVIEAFLLPLVMALIIQSHWPRSVQAILTFIGAFVATALTRYFMGEYGPVQEAVIQGVELFAITIPIYYGLWKPTTVAPKIEAATTF